MGRGHPYSNEKLGPILAFYTAENYEKGCEKVCEILHYEGAGHTFSMHTNDDKMVDYFARRVPASRVMVNTPSALGGIGGTTALQPALTLGCGAVGGSATSENVGPMHLLNLRYASRSWTRSAPPCRTAPTASAARLPLWRTSMWTTSSARSSVSSRSCNPISSAYSAVYL